MVKYLLIVLMIALCAGCSSKEERRDSLYEKAEQLEKAERCPEARVEAKNAIKLDPKFAKPYVLLARCDMKEQNWRGAMGGFMRAAELDPKNAEALLGMARIYLLANDPTKSQESVDKALALQPDSVEAQVIKAGIAIRKKDTDQAETLLRQVLAKNPEHEEALLGVVTLLMEKEKIDDAKKMLTDYLQKKPGSASVINYLTNIAFVQKDYQAAENYLNQLKAQFPDNAGIILRLGEVYKAAGQPEKAVALYDNTLENQPTNDTIRITVAENLMSGNQTAAALDLINKAPTLTPALRLVKSGMLFQIGKGEEGIAELRSVSDNPAAGEPGLRAMQRLAEIYAGQGKITESVVMLDGLLQKNPASIKALALRGRLYMMQGRYDQALADLRRVLTDDPKDYGSALVLAGVQQAQGTPRSAEDTLRNVLAKSPDYAPAYLMLAKTFVEQNRVDDALAILRTGADKVKNKNELLFAQGEVLTMGKRYPEAQKVYEGLSMDESTKTNALMRLAALMGIQQKYQDSMAYFDKILAIDPDSGTAAEGHARAQIAAGKTKEALAWSEKRRQERPKDPSAAALLAEAALANNDQKKAEEAYKTALELAPQWDLPVTRLAQIYVSTGRIDEAIKTCRDNLAKEPQSFPSAMLLALLLERKGDIAETEKTYRDIMVKFPEALVPANNLAYLISMHKTDPKSLEEALTFAQKAAASKNPAAVDTLGWILYQQKNYPEAIKNLQEAFANAQENKTIAYHLAVALAANGQKAEAAIILKKALEKDTEGFTELAKAQELLKTLE